MQMSHHDTIALIGMSAVLLLISYFVFRSIYIIGRISRRHMKSARLLLQELKRD